MGQPTQNPLSVRKSRVSDTPPQTADATPYGGRVSISACDDVQCLPGRARQLDHHHHDLPQGTDVPDTAKGASDESDPLPETAGGAPGVSLSVTPLLA